jgi:hypothetical protein
MHTKAPVKEVNIASRSSQLKAEQARLLIIVQGNVDESHVECGTQP